MFRSIIALTAFTTLSVALPVETAQADPPTIVY